MSATAQPSKRAAMMRKIGGIVFVRVGRHQLTYCRARPVAAPRRRPGWSRGDFRAYVLRSLTVGMPFLLLAALGRYLDSALLRGIGAGGFLGWAVVFVLRGVRGQR